MEHKSPIVAGFLSLIFPGIGSIYAGAAAKGISYMAVFFYSVYALSNGAEAWLFLVIFWTFAVVDAYKDAERTEVKMEKKSNLGWGIFWLLLGLIFQLQTLGYLRLRKTLEYWPLLLVILGIYLMIKGLKREGRDEKHKA